MDINLTKLEAALNGNGTTQGVALRRPSAPTQAEPKVVHTLPLTATREQTHGDYAENARIAQGLKRVLWSTEGWMRLTDHQRESAELMCTKFGRIFAGNPNAKEHWDDIAGYAKLCSDRIVEQ